MAQRPKLRQQAKPQPQRAKPSSRTVLQGAQQAPPTAQQPASAQPEDLLSRTEARIEIRYSTLPVAILIVTLVILGAALAFGVFRSGVPNPWQDPMKVLPLVAVGLGAFVAGYALSTFRAPPPGRDPAARTLPPVLAVATVVALVALAVILIDGAVSGAMRPAPAALVMLGGALSFLVGVHAIDSIRRSEGVALESHWGGLGGGLGGTRISAAAVLVFLLIVLSSATIIVGVANPDDISKALLAPPDNNKGPTDRPAGPPGAAAKTGEPAAASTPAPPANVAAP